MSLLLASKDFREIWEYNKLLVLSRTFLRDLNKRLLAEAVAVYEVTRFGYGSTNY
jgi:hypothetical protein